MFYPQAFTELDEHLCSGSYCPAAGRRTRCFEWGSKRVRVVLFFYPIDCSMLMTIDLYFSYNNF